MELKAYVLVAWTAIACCKARDPGVLFYDAEFKDSPRDQLIMTELIARDLRTHYNLPSYIPVKIRPRFRPNLTTISDLLLLTKRPRPPATLNGLDLNVRKISSIWRLNIEPACSRGFKLSRPRRSDIEQFSKLIVDAHSAKMSNLPESILRCTRDQWKQQSVIAGTTELRPFSIRTENKGKTEWSGSDINLFQTFAEKIGFNYTLVAPEDRTNGLPSNNSASVLVDMGLRREIDIAVFMCVYRPQSYFESVWPIVYGKAVLVIPPPTIVYDLFSNLKPFSLEVWVCVITCLIAVSVTMWMVSRILGLRSDLGLDFLYNVSLVTGQGGFNPKYLPGRFLATAWNLGAFVIVFSYTSILISFITARLPEPLISKMEDFVTKGTLKPVAGEGLVFSEYFLIGESGLRKQIGDIFRSNPETLTQTHSQALNMVLSGGYGYITGMEMAESSLYTDFRTSKKCRLMLLKTDVFEMQLVGWNTSKLVPTLTEILRKNVMRAAEAGIITKNERNYLPRIACLSMDNLLAAPTETPIYLIQLQTAFLVLGIGVFASISFFLKEKFIG